MEEQNRSESQTLTSEELKAYNKILQLDMPTLYHQVLDLDQSLCDSHELIS
jgi:hypothetical protein